MTAGRDADAETVERVDPLARVGQDFAVERGSPEPLGASTVRGGINFALFSHHATAVTLVLFAPGGRDPFMELSLDPRFHRTGRVWHALVLDLQSGFEYGYRIDGPRSPAHRFDPRSILLDPYARAVAGGASWGSGGGAPRGIVVDARFDWGLDQPLNTPLADTVIYEMHVRGFTQDASSGVAHRGTFAGAIEKLGYLKTLGVTAVELMPITEFDESNVPAALDPLTGRQLVNYWGYHPLAFFAPKASYAADRRPGGAVLEFKQFVRAAHALGIEVILDLVFNHTGEGGLDGATSSFRGIDNSTYYMVDPVSGAYRDFTGCGNTLNCNHPVVRSLILDCLRYWVTDMHVDGFRFDLASVLARGRNGEVLAAPPLLEHIAADPVLADTKLIAEAWDASGLYQVGSFPAWGRWAEWNGRFRDDVRRFVKGDGGMAGVLAVRLSGSPDLYRADGRTAHHSINFITSHDGFTLADLVAYNEKHNEGNGERSRDGADVNDSWNCGWEGGGAPDEVERLRQQQMRNLLSLLFLAQGVPMLLAGDEYGRTQMGNNNAYCQDSPLSWICWDETRRDGKLVRFVTELIEFRRTHAELTTYGFLDVAADGTAVVEWHGSRPHQPDWSDESRLMVMRLFGRYGGDVIVAANGGWQAVRLQVPALSPGRRWQRAIDTSQPSPNDIVAPAAGRSSCGSHYEVAPRSLIVLEVAASPFA